MSDDLVKRLRTGTTFAGLEHSVQIGPPAIQIEAADRIEELEAERDAAQAIAQDMRSKAFAATNPANWQKGDCSDAAMLKHFAETLDEIARANDYDVLERTMRAVFKYSVEPLQARADAAEAKLREAVEAFERITLIAERVPIALACEEGATDFDAAHSPHRTRRPTGRDEVSLYQSFGADVMMDMIRQLAKEAQKGNLVLSERITAAVNVMEELYPDAKRELDDLYGKKP